MSCRVGGWDDVYKTNPFMEQLASLTLIQKDFIGAQKAACDSGAQTLLTHPIPISTNNAFEPFRALETCFCCSELLRRARVRGSCWESSSIQIAFGFRVES